ncbi:MAG TPA: protocatechuate 3,4-dioxygenase subunit alpha [Bryobacteraceae bacterium]|nr:protocatechuate 3,4-dioxygenase subunit alpha [Bryobacteraceae bacterium]
MSRLPLTPSPYCTIGPFFPFEFVDACSDLTQVEGRKAQGQHILLTGRVVEEGNVPTLNVILELWQPDARGIFRHPLDPRFAEADPGFFGWGRARTDARGEYRFRTVLPGGYRGDDGVLRCPHINLMVLAIGLTRRLVTTVFFAESPAAVDDPVLRCVPDANRSRLFATRDPARDAEGALAYGFDLVLRGGEETPFFLD